MAIAAHGKRAAVSCPSLASSHPEGPIPSRQGVNGISLTRALETKAEIYFRGCHCEGEPAGLRWSPLPGSWDGFWGKSPAFSPWPQLRLALRCRGL